MKSVTIFSEKTGKTIIRQCYYIDDEEMEIITACLEHVIIEGGLSLHNNYTAKELLADLKLYVKGLEKEKRGWPSEAKGNKNAGIISKSKSNP